MDYIKEIDMGKSKRKSKIFPCAGGTSEKRDKQHSSRAVRRKVRAQLQQGDFDKPLPLPHEVVNPYRMDKDGKRYWPEATDKDMNK